MPGQERGNAVRWVAITGVSRGLGRALTRGFAAAGWAVAGCARDAAALGALADELGPPHRFAPVDVAEADAVMNWAHELRNAGVVPRLVVANAAVITPELPLWKVAPTDFAQLTATNINGVAYTAQAFVPLLIDAGRGTFVGMSSGWGRSTAPGVAPYCASKFAVEGMMQALAHELPRGVAALAVSPGVIDTDMLRTVWGQAASTHESPESWARRAVPYFASLGPRNNGRPGTVP